MHLIQEWGDQLQDSTYSSSDNNRSYYNGEQITIKISYQGIEKTVTAQYYPKRTSLPFPFSAVYQSLMDAVQKTKVVVRENTTNR
jgi:hypothetical protein